ncbi:hypothetical protein [Variovorax saccharolyticus]|uniref:hypothetical protein n=1 Tax=Variovorax saccharolyticus TaxID=3053516 RepID=UPI002575184E|nr:hypothetical protein [Variovorax sp. J31P216]MDM0030106.1 hypothetical protein [Variovorax sp. J31P216]
MLNQAYELKRKAAKMHCTNASGHMNFPSMGMLQLFAADLAFSCRATNRFAPLGRPCDRRRIPAQQGRVRPSGLTMKAPDNFALHW